MRDRVLVAKASLVKKYLDEGDHKIQQRFRLLEVQNA